MDDITPPLFPELGLQTHAPAAGFVTAVLQLCMLGTWNSSKAKMAATFAEDPTPPPHFTLNSDHSGTWRWTSRDLSHMAFRQVALMLISSSPEVSYRTTKGISDLSSISTAKIFPHVNDSTTFTRSGSSFRISNPGKQQLLSFLLRQKHRGWTTSCLFDQSLMVHF